MERTDRIITRGDIERYYPFFLEPLNPFEKEYKILFAVQEIPRKCVVIKDIEYSFEQFAKMMTEL